MEENRYRQLLSKAPFGYAYHKLVTNEEGTPIDYIFLEVNAAFEQLTGLKAKNIINKKVTEVIPTIKEGNFDWIKTYGDITLNRQTKEFEHFFIPLNKWYKITASATDTEHFTAIFTDITANQLIAKKLQELIDSTAETIDYTKICETIREISGARYVIFNKFEPNGKDFTTMAISGISELKKITEMLGFDIIKKQWKYDPDRESKIQNSKTTEFKSLSDLTGTVIPESIINLIQHTFNLSEFYLIKTMRNHIAIGDCTLFFKKGSTFINKELTETFVDAIGITLSRIADEELLTENENRYLELAEQSETITWEINKSGVYTFISPFIEKLLGYTPEEVIGKMHFYNLHPEQNEGFLLSASLQLFINKIPINNLENALLTKSNEIIWVSTTCLPVLDRYGELSGYRGTDTNITDKKLSEQSIKDKTILLQQITDNMNDAIFSLDLNLNLTYISPSIEKITGFSPEIYKTRTIEDRFTESSQDKIYTLFRKELENEKDPTINKKRIIKAELEERTADGSIVWVSVHISFVHNENGILTGFVGSSRDITERKTAERILRDSEEKFSKAFQGSPVSSIITRAVDGKIIDVNENFVALSGYSKEEALLSSSIHLDLWANIEDRNWVVSSLSSGVEIKNKEFQFRIKNNDIITGLFSAQFIHINNEPYLLSNILDITELKHSNESLLESEKKHRLLIENSRDIIYTLTPDGIFTFASPSWTTLLGHQLSEVIGHSFQQFVHPDDLQICIDWLNKTLSSTERSDTIEYRVIHANGSLHWHSSGGIALINQEGQLLGFEGVAHDITQRKIAQIELQESDARFKNMFDKHSMPMFLIEPNSGAILNANRSASKFYGYSIPTLRSMTINDINTLSPEQILEERNKAVNNIKHLFVFPHRLANNEIRTVEVHSSAIEYQGKPILFSIIQDITERMKAEEALKVSEFRYRFLFENMTEGVSINEIITDENNLAIDFRILSINDAYEHNTGLKPQDCIGKTILEIFPQADIEQIEKYGKVALTGEPMSFDYFSKTFNRHFHVRAFCPQPRHFATIFEDITESKTTDYLLEQTRQNYKNFFNTIHDFMFVLDEQGNIIYANNTVLNRLGYTSEELLGQSILITHPIDRQDEAKQTIKEMLEGTTDFCPIPLVTKSGQHILVETRVSKGMWDDKKAIFGVSADISKTVLSEEKFSKVFYLNPSASGLTDLITRKYVEVNDTFLKLFGFTREEVIGKTATELDILTTDAITKIMLNANTNGNVFNVEAELKAKNGDIKHVLLSSENIIIQDQKFLYTVVQDITERKLAERKQLIFSSLVHNSSTLFLVKDLDFRVIAANTAFLQATGLNTVEELLGKNDAEMMGAPEDSEVILAYRADDIKASMLPLGETLSKEEFVQTSRGIRTSLTQKFPIYTKEGDLLGIGVMSTDITEHKLIENQLKEKDLQFRKLSTNLPDLIFQFTRRPDGSYCIPIASPGIINIFSCTPEDVIDDFSPVSRVIHPEDAARVISEIEYSANNLTYFTCEFRVKIPGKSIQWIYSKSTPERLPDGSITWYGFNADITELKQAEEKLKERNLFVESLVNLSPNILYIYDIIGKRNIYVNDGIGKILGYSLQDIKDMGSQLLPTLMHPEDFKIYLEETLPKYAKAKDNEQIVSQYRMKHKNGEWHWFTATETIYSRHSNIKPKQIFGMIIDITERKLIEEELRKQYNLFDELLKNLPIGVYMLDAVSGKPLLANETSAKLLGRGILPEANSNTLTTIYDLYKEISNVPYPNEELPLVQAMNGITKQVDDMIVVHPNGNRINLEVFGAPIKDTNGNIWASIVCFQDITERKQAENALRKSQQMLIDSQTVAKIGSYVTYFCAASFTENTWEASPEIYKIFGAAETFTQKLASWFDYIHPAFKEEITAYFEKVVVEHLPFNYEYKIIRISDGEERWVHGIGETIYDENGTPIKMQGTIQDITERKTIENILILRESYLSAIIENQPGLIWLKDSTSRFLTVNQLFANSCELKDPKLIEGKTDFDIWPKELAEKYIHDDFIIMQNGVAEIIEEPIYNNGKVEWFETYKKPVFGRTGELLGTTGFSRNISERKITENILKISEEQNRTILHTTQDGVWTFSLTTGKFINANQTYCQMTNYTENELLQLSILDMDAELTPSQQADKIETIKKKGSLIFETKHRRKDGSVFDIELSMTYMNIEGEKLFCFCRDITERKQAEQMFQDIVEKNPISIQIIDKNGITLNANPAHYSLFGATPPEGFSIFDDLSSKSPELKKLVSLAKKGHVVRFPDTYYNPADVSPDLPNNPLWISALIFPLSDFRGKTERYVFMHENITTRKLAEEYRSIGSEILQKLNDQDTLQNAIQNVLTLLKQYTQFEAIGIRLQSGEDFPYFNQDGFTDDFLLMENSIIEHNSTGGICRNADGSACLECTCGLVISGTADLTNPTFTKNGSAWTNDSLQLQDIPLADDPRHNPRNTCIHKGYASIALVPIKANDTIIGLIQVNDKRKGQLTIELVEFFETIASHIGSALLRKKAEENLKINEQTQANMILNISDVIGIIDINGVVKYKSPNIEKFFGWLPSDLIGYEAWNTVHPDDLERVQEAFTSLLLKDGATITIEYKYKCKNEGYKPIKLTATNLINDSFINGVLLNYHDITERTITENNLKNYANKLELSNKELAEFVYIASHDLKEPLRGISNCASFIKMDHPKLEETVTTKIDHIIELAERLDIFINELLSFSKIGNTDIVFDYYNIKEIVEDSIENIRSCGFYTNSEIIIKDFPDNGTLCNKERLKYVYQNLITNGLKYNNKKHKRIEIGSFYENNQNVFYVYDNGIGIEEKHHEIIFQIFKRLHPKEDFSGGTGVGLAIVKKVILQHHGKIWLKSTPNQGTTFYFTLNIKKD